MKIEIYEECQQVPVSVNFKTKKGKTVTVPARRNEIIRLVNAKEVANKICKIFPTAEGLICGKLGTEILQLRKLVKDLRGY